MRSFLNLFKGWNPVEGLDPFTLPNPPVPASGTAHVVLRGDDKKVYVLNMERQAWEEMKPRPKKATNEIHCRDIVDRHEGLPFGRLNIDRLPCCMDATCICGTKFHVDGFLMQIKCWKCGRVYLTNPRVELIEMENPVTAIPIVEARGG